MSTPSSANVRNQVAGTWRIVSAQAEVDGKIIKPFGPNPIGLLIFAEDLHFAETIVNPDVPKFASDNRTTGTEAENKAAISGGLGNSGTCTVDDQGRFSSEHLCKITCASFGSFLSHELNSASRVRCVAIDDTNWTLWPHLTKKFASGRW